MAVDMDLKVATFLVSQGSSELNPAAAADHHKLREFMLADNSLLYQGDSRQPGLPERVGVRHGLCQGRSRGKPRRHSDLGAS